MARPAPVRDLRVPIQAHVELLQRPRAGRAGGFSLPFLTLAMLALAGLAIGYGGWVLGVALVVGASTALVLALASLRPAARPDPSEADPPADPLPDPPGGPGILWVTQLADVVEFLGRCLERDDLEGLRAACEEDAQPGSFAWLRERHTAQSLRDLYADTRLPELPGEFKLGGHERELGHVHVDLASRDGARWWLRRVWTCR